VQPLGLLGEVDGQEFVDPARLVELALRVERQAAGSRRTLVGDTLAVLQISAASAGDTRLKSLARKATATSGADPARRGAHW
jgi:hypothetical protein